MTPKSLPSRLLAPLACVLLLVTTTAATAAEVTVSPAVTAAEAGLVDVRTLASDIALDMRYAGWHNFTARPVPGYEAPKCLLLEPVAQALAKVQARLRTQGYSLLMFDCYRPVRAVKAFVAWAADPDDQANKVEFYPALDKARIIPDGYVAEVSGHSRGATVDLGLLDCRKACTPLDMGTGFDYFGPRAHTEAPGLSEAQRRNRRRLLDAMTAGGFENYANEWWHYTFKPEPTPHTAYDVPVR